MASWWFWYFAWSADHSRYGRRMPVCLVSRFNILGKQRYWIICCHYYFWICITPRIFFDPGVDAIEAIDPIRITGYLGGLGLPILFAWPVGALFAAGVAFVIGKIALGSSL